MDSLELIQKIKDEDYRYLDELVKQLEEKFPKKYPHHIRSDLLKLYFIKGLQYLFDLDNSKINKHISRRKLSKAAFDYEVIVIRKFVKLLKIIEATPSLKIYHLKSAGFTYREFKYIKEDMVIRSYLKKKIDESKAREKD